MDTFGSSFDTVLAVYTGNVLSNLVYVTSNDDADDTTLQSQVSFNAVGGTVYDIAVDGYNATTYGPFIFEMALSNPFPIITGQPQSQSVNQGSIASFSVAANGPGTLLYQWYFNGGSLPNATNTTLALTNVSSANDGPYFVVVNNSSGSITSSVATLSVRIPPMITVQPSAVVVNPGSNATFTVTATGTGPLLYQWRFNGNTIAGATNSSFARSNVQYTNGGLYSVVIANATGSDTSPGAELIIKPQFISTQITNTGFFLLLNGTPGKSYSIEAAANLSNWISLGSVSNSAVNSQFLDTNRAANPIRSYRLKLLP
jgi:hypothetical protein